MRTTLVAAVASASVLAGAAAGAIADASFTDPEADQRNTLELVAPDITSVDVSNTRAGVITFRVRVANYPALPPNGRVAVLFDLDKRIETGDAGFERTVRHDVDSAGQATVVFERFNEESFRLEAIPGDNIASTYADGVYTLSIPRADLENTIGFEFGLYAAVLDSPGDDHAVDSAPDQELWTYALVGLPAPRLLTTRLTGMPRRPVAGRQFTVSTAVRRQDTNAAPDSAAVTCTARVGTTRLRAVGRFRDGRAHCVITVPRSAKGKALRGTITTRVANARVQRAFSYRVA